MAYETLIASTEGAVRVIRLNRPQALNALSDRMWAELLADLAAADADDAIRAIVITGSDKAFAAGADITEMADKTYADMAGSDYLAEPALRGLRVRKPTIAAVAGYCLGGGCELAMMCDILIAADTARFGQPEINLGIIAGLGGTQRLTRAIGKAKAMEMHLTGRLMDAAEAERAGLVARVVAPEALMAEALAIAEKIAAKGRLAVMAARDAVDRAFELPLSEGLRYERRLFQALFSTEDQKEGMAAFRDKRTPRFHDR